MPAGTRPHQRRAGHARDSALRRHRTSSTRPGDTALARPCHEDARHGTPSSAAPDGHRRGQRARDTARRAGGRRHVTWRCARETYPATTPVNELSEWSGVTVQRHSCARGYAARHRAPPLEGLHPGIPGRTWASTSADGVRFSVAAVVLVLAPARSLGLAAAPVEPGSPGLSQWSWYAAPLIVIRE
jgi:hypothetical protein